MGRTERTIGDDRQRSVYQEAAQIFHDILTRLFEHHQGLATFG
jgi:hypothetical protein